MDCGAFLICRRREGIPQTRSGRGADESFSSHYQEGIRPHWLRIDTGVRRHEGQLATCEILIKP